MRSNVGVTNFAAMQFVEERDLSSHGLSKKEIDAISRALSTYQKCVSWWSANKNKHFSLPGWMKERARSLPQVEPMIIEYIKPLREKERRRR